MSLNLVVTDHQLGAETPGGLVSLHLLSDFHRLVAPELGPRAYVGKEHIDFLGLPDLQHLEGNTQYDAIEALSLFYKALATKAKREVTVILPTAAVAVDAREHGFAQVGSHYMGRFAPNPYGLAPAEYVRVAEDVARELNIPVTSQPEFIGAK